jgi:hypothetical protein
MNSIDRLRSARPALAEPPIDGDALFAAITARPRDLSFEPAPGTQRSRRRLLVAAVVALALMLTAGTALAGPISRLLGWHEETHLVGNPRQWRALYHTATRQLTLPPGQSWPYRTLPPNTITSVNEPGGMAVAISQAAWECYWVQAIRGNDTAAQHRARVALADIVAHHILVAPPGSSENVAPPAGSSPPFEIFASDGGIQYIEKMYADAAAGHPATLIQSCRANGPHS